MKIRILGLVAMTVVAASGAVQADVLYSNLGSGSSFDATSVQIQPATYQYGWQFTASATGMAASVDAPILPFGDNNPTQVTVNFALISDVSDHPSGATLESFSITSTGLLASPSLATATLSGTTQLTAGQKYWLIGIANNQWAWNWNNLGLQGTYTFGGLIHSPYTMTAFRINGVAAGVPEPGTLALLGLGLAGLGLTRRRNAGNSA